METRASRGLEQIIGTLSDRTGLRVLDLAGARTETITFLANMGHRVTSDDIQFALDTCFGGGDFLVNQEDPERIEKFQALSEQERLALIFLPGLSTAKQVTDVSGRGVGMDA